MPSSVELWELPDVSMLAAAYEGQIRLSSAIQLGFYIGIVQIAEQSYGSFSSKAYCVRQVNHKEMTVREGWCFLIHHLAMDSP